MTNFEHLQEQLFQQLSLTNGIGIVGEREKQTLGQNKNLPLWKVSIEVPAKGAILEFQVLVQLKDDFPVSLPKIFLQSEEYEPIKYLPHIESNLKICLFDQENIKLDIERPLEILRASLKQAAKVIGDGIDGTNNSDFLDEIVAYWNLKYDKNDNIVPAFTGEGIEDIQPGTIPCYWLDPAYTNVNILLFPENENNDKLLEFFKKRGHKIERKNAFYLGELVGLKPPFYFRNGKAYEFIRSRFPGIFKEFKSYFNYGNYRKTIVFSVRVEGVLVFFAFFYFPFSFKQNGWRPQSLTPVFLISQVQPNEPVTRLTFKAFEQNRLLMRTDGVLNNDNKFQVAVAGLGSIGSHLIEYLSELPISAFQLIDPEDLALENVNRHLLSYHEVGYPKVDGIMRYLKAHNPFLIVRTIKSSIVDLIKNDDHCLKSDLIFCVIGKDAIEDFILQHVANGKISSPLVIMWIEPFLIGAHVLYILPGTQLKMKDLEIEGYYKYNVIASQTYKDKNKDLLLKEAGCQGSYMPYGKLAIRECFSLMLPFLKKLFSAPPTKNVAMTYLGDLELARVKDLDISSFATESFKLITQSF